MQLFTRSPEEKEEFIKHIVEASENDTFEVSTNLVDSSMANFKETPILKLTINDGQWNFKDILEAHYNRTVTRSHNGTYIVERRRNE